MDILIVALLLAQASTGDVPKKDDPWQKVTALASGQEVRIIKKGAVGKPLLGVFDEANAERVVIVVKNEQIAIAKEDVDRLDARPKGGSRVTKSSKSTQNMPMDRPPSANPGDRVRPVPPGSTSETSSGLNIGSKPDFEPIYRRILGAPAK